MWSETKNGGWNSLGLVFRCPVTICVLFYGDHPKLCERFLRQLYCNTSAEHFRLRVGLNAVGTETRLLIRAVAETYKNISVIDSAQNLFKPAMMRRLFTEPGLTTDWVLWFDDDSYPVRADWLQTLALSIEAAPEVAMWGSPRWITPDPALLEFTQKAPWFRDKEFLRDPQSDSIQYHFIVGGYWGIRSTVIRQLDWPDPRLVHVEDDYVLGEALRQNGYTIGECESGVVINCATRRCPAGTPRSFA